jgi:hypothetical protein
VKRFLRWIALLVLGAFIVFPLIYEKPPVVTSVNSATVEDAMKGWVSVNTPSSKGIYYTADKNPKHIFIDNYNYIYTEFGVFAFEPSTLSFEDFVSYIYAPLLQEKNHKNKNNISPHRLLNL